MSRKVHVASFGIVPLQKEGDTWRVLLILHQGGRHWAFPKGRSNPGETPLQSAQRELKEETGLDIERLLKEEPLTERYEFRRQQEIVIKTVQYFPALVKGEVKLQPEEIQDSKWVPLQEAPSHLTFREAQEICKKLIAELCSPGV